MLSFEQFKELRKKGLSPQQIASFEAGNKPQKTEEEPGFVKSTLRSIASPFVKAGKTTVAAVGGAKNLVDIGIAKVRGDEEAVQRNLEQGYGYQKPTNLGYLGNVTPFKNPGEGMAAGAEIGSYFIGGGGLKTATQTGLKGLVKQGIKQGIKYEALSGGIGSLGNALQQEDKSFGSVTSQTLVGTGLGGLFGGVAGGLSGAFGAIRPKNVIQNVANTYDELFTSTKTGTRIVNKSAQQGKSASTFLAQHGDLLDVADGAVNAQPVIQRVSQRANALDDVLDGIIAEKTRIAPYERLNLSKIAQAAKNRLNTAINRGTGELQKINKAVDDTIRDLGKTYGADDVDLSIANEIRKGQWKASSAFNLADPKFIPDVHYAIGREVRDAMLEMIPEADVKGLLRYMGDHFDAINLLRKIDGNKVKGGRLGRYFARTLGAVVGSGGGPAGSLMGASAGDAISSLMQNTYIAGPIKRLILSKVPPTSPGFMAAQQALRKLQKAGTASQAPLMLPAAGRTLYTPNVPPSSQGVTPRGDVIIAGPPTGKVPTRLYSVAAGLDKDDEGNITFNPERAVAALGFTAVLGKANPKLLELGKHINTLNQRWVKNPSPANKKALEAAVKLYKSILGK